MISLLGKFPYFDPVTVTAHLAEDGGSTLLTRQFLCAIRSLNTYNSNGGSNGGSPPSVNDKKTIDNLYNEDITTPGYIRIPVCSPDEAYKNWVATQYKKPRSAHYPCN